MCHTVHADTIDTIRIDHDVTFDFYLFIDTKARAYAVYETNKNCFSNYVWGYCEIEDEARIRRRQQRQRKFHSFLIWD